MNYKNLKYTLKDKSRMLTHYTINNLSSNPITRADVRRIRVILV
jgi:hypothetical protein